jgi:hypothetical protein
VAEKEVGNGDAMEMDRVEEQTEPVLDSSEVHDQVNLPAEETSFVREDFENPEDFPIAEELPDNFEDLPVDLPVAEDLHLNLEDPPAAPETISTQVPKIPVDENLNETTEAASAFAQPSTSSSPTDFDEEAFFDSLDMEKLFIVEAQRDGQDVYEIYGTDPLTQEMCEKPMDLPQRYIDLIIKVMTQEDDDE